MSNETHSPGRDHLRSSRGVELDGGSAGTGGNMVPSPAIMWFHPVFYVLRGGA